MPIVAYVVACTFLFFYAVFSCIEFGGAVFILLPHIFHGSGAVKRYANPIWEATNVFLVFFLITLFTCFPKAMPLLSAALLPLVEIGVLFFGLRALGILGIFYAHSNHLLWRILLALGSIGAPVTLSGVYGFLLTGELSFSALSLAMAALVVSSIAMISSSFFLYFDRHPHAGRPHLKALAQYGVLAFDMCSFFTLIALSYAVPGLIGSPIHALFFVVGLGGFSCAALIFHHLKRWRDAFLCVCVLLGCVFFWIAVLHVPYLAYPSVTLQAAFTTPEIFRAIFLALLVGLIFLIPALVLLYYLFLVPREESYPGADY